MTCQKIVLPSKGTSTGWRNGLNRNLMKFKKRKCRVLLLLLGRNSLMHQYALWGCPAGKQLGRKRSEGPGEQQVDHETAMAMPDPHGKVGPQHPGLH